MGTVQFILGRAGTGKTTHLVDAITDLCRADPLGRPIYWLLPKQATFQAERLLTAKLGGFARVHVVDFARLSKIVLDSCGDVGMPEVTPAGRRMVIGHLLRRHRDRLAYYGRSALRAGLANELDATFGEFERAGVDVGQLRDLIDAIDPAGDPATETLRQKLSDLHLLLDRYDAFIGDDRVDPARRFALVLKRIAECDALRGARLFVDDFHDFTGHERKLLTEVAAIAGQTRIAMTLDRDDPDASDTAIFHRPQRAYRALLTAMKGLPIAPPIHLNRTHNRTPALDDLEWRLFSTASVQVEADITSIDLFDAPDKRAEVDAVARQIRAAVGAGARCRDVAVLVRSLGDYREIVQASFAEHGIPWFADHRRSAGHHPLLGLIRGCLLIARDRWPHEAVMQVAKSGLAGLSDDEADELENYVLRHRLSGRDAWESPEPWRFGSQLTRAGDDVDIREPTSDRAGGHRQRLAASLAPLLDESRTTATTARTISTALFATLEAFGVRATLARWMADADAAGDAQRRGEHEQVWAEFVALLDQMVDLLGNEQMSVADFLDVLDAGLEQFDLAIPPPAVDQVLLGEIDRTRTPAVGWAFVLGLSEGMFPRVQQDPLVLSDAERRTLRERHVELNDDVGRQLLDERFLAYVAFTRARQHLVISRPLADDRARALHPSQFWLELLRLFPGIAARCVPRSSASDPTTIGTPRQLTGALMQWALRGWPDADSAMAPLYQWFAAAAAANLSAIDRMRTRAWPALAYRNEASLDPSRSAELFGSPLEATVRQLEDESACPFRHFARHGLALRGRQAEGVTGLDLHNAYHWVVETLTRELLSKRTDWTQLSPEQARQRIRVHTAEVGRRLRDEVMLSSARNRYLLDHIERTLERAVASMAEVNRSGKYRPWRANLRFGSGPDMPHLTIETPKHRQVQLCGQIDRVDLNERGTAFTISDYKLSPTSLALDRVYHGLSLKLLTYLLVLQANQQSPNGKPLTPAAAFLVGLASTPALVLDPNVSPAPDEAAFRLRVKPRGLIDERAVDSLDAGRVDDKGWSTVVAAHRKKQGGFGHRHASDIASAEEFAALLARVEAKLGEAADRVIDGDVRVLPYLLGRATPCARCEFRTVCRFEPGLNPYRVLPAMSRAEVLLKVSGGDCSEPD